MHQIHAVGKAREATDKGWGFLTLNAGEKHKYAEGCQKHIGGTEFPRPFYHGGLDELARNTLPPETPCCKHCTNHKTSQAYDNPATSRPFDVNANVMGQYEIAEIAGTIPKHGE